MNTCKHKTIDRDKDPIRNPLGYGYCRDCPMQLIPNIQYSEYVVKLSCYVSFGSAKVYKEYTYATKASSTVEAIRQAEESFRKLCCDDFTLKFKLLDIHKL